MELNNFAAPSSIEEMECVHAGEKRASRTRNEDVKYRSLARQLADDEAALRVQALITERKLREMDE